MGILKAHMDTMEAHLLSAGRISASSGHSIHKGTPRETFIRDYLQDHISQDLAIGTGEIIDASSQPNEPRNQHDIVLYRRNYPRLSFGGGINGFLVESVVATIEVKSLLTAEELAKSIRASQRVKSLQTHVVKSFHAGYQPPGILSYVVAYDGPASMKTVQGWIDPIYKTHSIVAPTLGPTGNERLKVASPSIDAIFVLGRGFVQFDNSPIGFVTDDIRRQQPNLQWSIADTPSGSLLLFFACLTAATSGTTGSWLNPLPYLSDFALPGGPSVAP